ncbi:hypothetical protein [Nonlabens sp.]|uniref:hypothetical protein n=1 Tax=Nonlabens sp. TaxID=1888209 RepID=UPI003F69F9BF
MKTTLLKLPEYYFILLAILAGYTPPFDFNLLFLMVALVFVAQIIFKNRVSGLLLAIVTGLINLLFLGALLSEFQEFESFTGDAQQLLFVGLSIFTLNSVATGIMFYKYMKNTARKELNSNSAVTRK